MYDIMVVSNISEELFSMEYPIALYYDTDVTITQTLDLCRGDDDYRKVHIVDDGHRKLVIKHLSNTFRTGEGSKVGSP